MSRIEFLQNLEYYLRGIPEADKNEILYDYEEHFRIGLEQGKTEEEIARSLGDVRSIARQFRAQYTIREAESNSSTRNIMRAVLATVALGFFNLVVVLGPFIALVALLISIFVLAVSLVAAGVGVLLSALLSPVFPSFISFDTSYPFAIFTAVGVGCLGLLIFIGSCYIAKFFYTATLRYLRWNIDFIRK